MGTLYRLYLEWYAGLMPLTFTPLYAEKTNPLDVAATRALAAADARAGADPLEYRKWLVAFGDCQPPESDRDGQRTTGSAS